MRYYGIVSAVLGKEQLKMKMATQGNISSSSESIGNTQFTVNTIINVSDGEFTMPNAISDVNDGSDIHSICGHNVVDKQSRKDVIDTKTELKEYTDTMVKSEETARKNAITALTEKAVIASAYGAKGTTNGENVYYSEYTEEGIYIIGPYYMEGPKGTVIKPIRNAFIGTPTGDNFGGAVYLAAGETAVVKFTKANGAEVLFKAVTGNQIMGPDTAGVAMVDVDGGLIVNNRRLRIADGAITPEKLSEDLNNTLNCNKIYEADISRVGSDNNILYITVPGATSYNDLNGKSIKLYTGIYSNNKTQTVYLNINDLGAKAIWRVTADGTFQNCTYAPYEVNRYTVMELYFSGGTVCWVNPPGVVTAAEKAELNTSVESLRTYSTTPQRIGTWVDGTPVWRVAIRRKLTESELSNSYVSLMEADLGINDIYISNLFLGGSLIVSDSEYDSDNFLTLYGDSPFVFLRNKKDVSFKDVGMTSVYGYVEFATPESNITS